MKILTLSVLFSFLSFCLGAQCVENVSLRIDPSNCRATLTYGALSLGRFTAAGDVTIRAPGRPVQTVLLPYQFTAADIGITFSVAYQTAELSGFMIPASCEAILRIQPTETPCPSCAAPISAPTVNYNSATNQTTISWTASPTPVFDYLLDYYSDAPGDILRTLSSTTNSLSLSLIKGAHYTFRTRIRCTSSITSDYSPSREFFIPCVAPQITSLTPNSSNGVTVRWSGILGVSGYFVEYRPSVGPDVWQSVAVFGTTTYSTPALTQSITYLFRIKTRCFFGATASIISDPSPTASIQTQIPCPAPNAPIINYILAANTTYLSLQPLTGALGYIVEYRYLGSTGPFSSFFAPASSFSTVYTLPFIEIGTSYEFRLRVRCTASIVSQPSAVTILNVPCPVVAAAPTVVRNDANNSATVSWNAVLGAHRYVVEYRPANSTGAWQSRTITDATTTTFTNLVGGINYDFRVSVSCPGSVLGEPTPTSTVNIPCLAPSGGYVIGETTNSARLNWYGEPGVTGYKIMSDGIVVATVNGNSYTATNLLPDNTYNFSIIALCNDAEREGLVLSFTTLPSPTPLPCVAPAVSISNIKPTSAIVNWTALANARRYRVNYKLSTATEWQTLTTAATSVTLDGLTPRDLGDHTYDIQVLSICSNSSTSAPASAQFDTKSSCPEIDAPMVNYTTIQIANVIWNNESEATSYIVEHSPLPFNPATAQSQSVATNTAILRGLLPNIDYAVRVKTVCGARSSDFSPQTAFRTNQVVCTTPPRLRAANVTANTALVLWTTVPNAIGGYELSYRTADPETAWTTVTTATSAIASTNLTGLASGTPYQARVRSNCPFGNQSNWSAIYTFSTTGAPAPLIAAANTTPSRATTLIGTKAFNFSLALSPNPTKGLISLAVESENEQTLSVSVTNRLGQLVMQQKVETINKGLSNLSLDLSTLPNDMYFLQVFNGVSSKSEKIVVMH
jgi:Secretion system C-terminal sorting domain/Fibronectin type III domain